MVADDYCFSQTMSHRKLEHVVRAFDGVSCEAMNLAATNDRLSEHDSLFGWELLPIANYRSIKDSVITQSACLHNYRENSANIGQAVNKGDILNVEGSPGSLQLSQKAFSLFN